MIMFKFLLYFSVCCFSVMTFNACGDITGSDDSKDDYGNSLTSAYTITSGDTLGKLESKGDIDYFKLELTKSSEVSLYTIGDIQTIVELYNENGEPLKKENGNIMTKRRRN